MNIVEKLLGGRGRIVSEHNTVESSSPHGIYIYDNMCDKWLLIDIYDDYFKPRHDGVYVIYFDNAKCGACRVYDIHWFPYVRLLGSTMKNIYFIVVLCEWFARNCRSEKASNTFKFYDVHSSPTTVLLSIRNSVETSREKIEGIKTMDTLAVIVEEFAKKNGFEI
ncbi:MAG: hypothetical protein QXX35_03640 [Desulfurococcaceae archaeon]